MISPANPKRISGFTLLETLVVLTILGLTLALFASRGTDHSKAMELRHAADSLAESLRLARTEAILHGRAATLTLSADPPGWIQADGETKALPSDIKVTGSTTPAFGTTAATDQIRFEPDGSSSGGTVALDQDTHRVLIDIDWLTGRVAVAPIVTIPP